MANLTQVNQFWARPRNTTIEDHLKGEQVNIVRSKKILALMEKKGLISYGHGGVEFTWRVRKRQNSLTPYDDGDNINRPRVNRHEVARLPYRGYVFAESVTAMEKEANKGKEAIVNFVSNLTNWMLQDFKDGLGPEFFVDGNASGNESRFHGFDSALGVTSNAQYTAPSDTYAGLSTVLGNYGGNVLTGSWPYGTFDPEYYFWSPTVVNYTHDDWVLTSTWAAACLEVLRAGIIAHKNIKAKQGMLETIFLTASMYKDVLELLDDKERILVERNGQQSDLVALGFKDVVNYDGVDLTYDYDVPATRGYGLSWDKSPEGIELRVMGKQLVTPSEAFYLPNLSDEYALHLFGNMKLNPRSMLLFDNIT